MFTKLRFKFELFGYYFKKNLPFLVLGLAFGFIVYFFQKPLFQLYLKLNQPVTKIGIEGQFTASSLPSEISQLLSSGLTVINENGKASPSRLVKSLDISPDSLRYTFEIQPNTAWHDGKRLTSFDINYKIPGLIFTPESEDKITVSSEKAYAPLLALLSQPLFKKNLIGLGNHRVTKIQYLDGYIRYLKLKSTLGDNRIYRFYPNQTDLLNAFKIGEVDQIRLDFLPPELETGWQVNINQNVATSTRYSAIFLNTQKLNSKQLRQSLAYATPKTTDKNERCLSPISPSSWAYNPQVKEYNFNPTKAREFFEKNKIDSISLIVNNRNLLPLGESVKKSWEDILKLKVDLKIDTQPDLNNYEALLVYGSVPTDPDQYVFWHSTQTKTNLTKINNPKIDKLLEDGRLTFDIQERKKIYQEFQRSLLEESPVIFLQYPTIYTITRNQ